MTRKKRWLSFCAGILTGTVATLLLVAAVTFIGGNQTWSLRVNTYGVTDKMEGAAKLVAADMLPLYIEELKAEVPDLVAENVNGQFGDVKFQLGDEVFLLPKEFVAQLEENYRSSMVESINELLNTMPLDKMSSQLGAEVATLVEQALYAEFNSKKIEVDLIDEVLSVPVIIELVSQPGVNAFRLQLYSEEDSIEQ